METVEAGIYKNVSSEQLFKIIAGQMPGLKEKASGELELRMNDGTVMCRMPYQCTKYDSFLRTKARKFPDLELIEILVNKLTEKKISSLVTQTGTDDATKTYAWKRKD